ncbi:MAG: bifunctional riboflavin kinase/FAD synthetase [Gammaproteobacteria bacterium]|nr:bifunctional riboflavin kinase/FAD synthetase [Gammaproteobacteria bacterium]
MLLLRDLSDKTSGPIVATLGNFDGVHLGHREILHALQEVKKRKRLNSAVILFEPQPREYFLDTTSERLMSLRQKIEIFKKFDVDMVVCLRFNAKLAALSAREFVENVLLRTLHVEHLVVGSDCAFGYKGTGNIALLREYERKGSLVTDVVDAVSIDGVKVSSSRIKQVLKQGDFVLAQKMLGMPYRLGGKVSHGDERGRQLGYPTANIVLRYKVSPLSGVYFGKVILENEREHSGIANIGYRPTFAVDKPLLEIHILNFNQNLYGQKIYIEFSRKIRDEIKFNSKDELISQIEKDLKHTTP